MSNHSCYLGCEYNEDSDDSENFHFLENTVSLIVDKKKDFTDSRQV